MAGRKPKKTPFRRETASGRKLVLQAETAGILYASSQLDSDYFRDWVADQILEASKMDPSKVIPLQTDADAQRIARRMLQQLDFDTRRDLKADEIEALLKIDRATPDVINAFYAGFERGLRNPSTVGWLAEEIFEIKNGIDGGTKTVDAPRTSRRGRRVSR